MFGELVIGLGMYFMATANDRKTQRRAYKEYKEKSDQGAYLPENYYNGRDAKYEINIQYGDGTCVPEEYRKFLKHNPLACYEYVKAMIAEEDINIDGE